MSASLHKPRGFALAEQIIRRQAGIYGVAYEDLIGPRRTATLTAIRDETIRMVSERAKLSSPEIGELFNRDHSTILYSLRRTE